MECGCFACAEICLKLLFLVNLEGVLKILGETGFAEIVLESWLIIVHVLIKLISF
jgi:hypothetical protein